MSRSIFNPGGEETEHSGQRFTPQKASQTSQMPPDLVDGEVSKEEAQDLEKLAHRNEIGETPEQALEEMTEPAPPDKVDPDAPAPPQ